MALVALGVMALVALGVMALVALGVMALVALHMGPSVLDKVVNKDGPGSLLVIVGQIVIHCRRKVQQQVPRVLNRDRRKLSLK